MALKDWKKIKGENTWWNTKKKNTYVLLHKYGKDQWVVAEGSYDSSGNNLYASDLILPTTRDEATRNLKNYMRDH